MRVNIGRLLQVAMPSKSRSSSIQTTSSNVKLQQDYSRGTVQPNANFNGEQAASKLHAAFHKATDTDVATILEVLMAHNNQQRQRIKRHYHILSDKSLELDVYEFLGGNFRDVSLMLLQTPLDLLAQHIHIAIQRVGPEAATMTELLWGCTNARLHQIKETYRKKYGRDLDMVVRRELNGDFQRLMRILLTTEREENSEVDINQATKDAQVLVVAGVGVKYETDDAVVIELLQKRSFAHLREIFEQFYQLSHRNIEDNISAEFKRDLRGGLVSIVKASREPAAFFAEQINETLQGASPRDSKLMRILVARSEIDLADIKDSYLQVYGVKLAEAITDVTSGDYRRYLHRLIGHYDN